MIVRLHDEFIDCLLETEGIRFVEIRQRDEAVSQKGIFVRYADEHEIFIYSDNTLYNRQGRISELYEELSNVLKVEHRFVTVKE